MREALLRLGRSWQPIAVVAGAAAFVAGVTATVAEHLGAWPSVAVCGALVCAGALLWGRLTVVEAD